MKDKKTPEQMWNDIDKSVPGCWDWPQLRPSDGYGWVSHQGQTLVAHRWVYVREVGPIPAGLQIDHVKAWGCVSRACVRPSHLEAVTSRENQMRTDSVVARNARKTHCLREHPLTGDNLYVRPDGARSCLACQAMRSVAYRKRKAESK